VYEDLNEVGIPIRVTFGLRENAEQVVAEVTSPPPPMPALLVGTAFLLGG